MNSKKSKKACALVLFGCLLAADAGAQSSFTNSFTGFTGDTSQTGTRNALAFAGFEVTDSNDFNAVNFGVTGARFGGNLPGDDGHNYIRTIAANYATVNFEALITFIINTNTQNAYVGVGGGEIETFGRPDWGSDLSSASVFLTSRQSEAATFRQADVQNEFIPLPDIGSGQHRVRISFNAVAKTITFAMDLNYSGEPFTADINSGALDVTDLFGPTGWPAEPSRIFFGGDDSVILKDLAVTVTPVPTTRPTLHVAKLPPSSVRLSWPTNAIAFRLEQNTTVGSTNWVNVTNTPVIVGDEKQVTLPIGQTNLLFHLVQP